MSALFDRLRAQLERGHARPAEGLLNDARFADAERTAEAAVLIAVTDAERPGVILTQRPATMRDHPGQVAFPGGKREEGETPVEAALREAHEELALDPALVRVIGTTDGYRTGTGFAITPVLGVIPANLSLVACRREVESWFEAPLDLVMNPGSWRRGAVFWKGATREYLELEHAGYRIWGVTAAICYNLSLRLAWHGTGDG